MLHCKSFLKAFLRLDEFSESALHLYYTVKLKMIQADGVEKQIHLQFTFYSAHVSFFFTKTNLTTDSLVRDSGV